MALRLNPSVRDHLPYHMIMLEKVRQRIDQFDILHFHNGRRRVQFAIDLALRTGARLSGLHVMPPPDVPPLYKPSQMDEAIANMASKLASNPRAAKEAFHG